MNDVKLDNVQLVKHLGHILTSDLSDDKDILHQTSMYNRKANAVLSDFKHISGNLRVKIVQSYCSSFYGSQLWDLSNNCIDRLSISWRKTIRKALNIPVRTHSVYLPLICECLPLNVQLELRVMKFFMNGLNSTNNTFRFSSEHASDMSFCRGSVNCHGSDGQMYHFCESSRSGEIFLDQYRGGGGLYSP